MQGIANEKDTFDGSVRGTGKLDQSINSSSSTLRVSLEDKAFIGTRL